MPRLGCVVLLLFPGVLGGCGAPPPLTEERARALVLERAIDNEPVYAEVPERVWWGPDFPKDDYDELALQTLRNLEAAGLVTLRHDVDGETESWTAAVTREGFPILGKVSSARGRALRALVCVKKIDRVSHFVRHPTEPTVGSADLVWHYERPTTLYEAFETKVDKPLGKPFRSVVSIPSNSRPVANTRAVKSHSARRIARVAGSALSTGHCS